MNAYVTALSSTMIADNGVGNASSQLQMQITRDELNSTFTCKVNSTALVEPLTVDIKLDVHGKYACVRVTFPTHDQTSLSPKSESLKADKRFFIDVSIDRNRTENNPSELDSLESCTYSFIWTSRCETPSSLDDKVSEGCEIRSSCVFLSFLSVRARSIVSGEIESLLRKIESFQTSCN